MKYLEINKEENSSLFEIILNHQRKLWFELLLNKDLSDDYDLTEKQLSKAKQLQKNLVYGLPLPVKQLVIYCYKLTMLEPSMSKQRKQLKMFYRNICDGITAEAKTKFLLESLYLHFLQMEEREKQFSLFEIRDKMVFAPFWRTNKDGAEELLKKSQLKIMKAIQDCIRIKEEAFKKESLNFRQHIDFFYDDFKESTNVYESASGEKIIPIGFGYYPSSRALAHLENLGETAEILPITLAEAKKELLKTKHKNSNLLMIQENDTDFRAILGMRNIDGGETIYMLREVEKSLLGDNMNQ